MASWWDEKGVDTEEEEEGEEMDDGGDKGGHDVDDAKGRLRAIS